jgi:hypothetical protein
LYGCETWSHKLRAFENRVLRRIFGPTRDEIIGSWRKLHNEELHDFYSSKTDLREIGWSGMNWNNLAKDLNH